MHRPFPAFSVPRTVVRLKDPQMQVWIMAGLAVLLVLIGHLRAWSPSGEGKNASAASASKLLLGGAKLEWTEDFGPARPAVSRPVLVLNSPDSVPRQHSARPELRLKPKSPSLLAVNLDVRPVMQEAAGKSWKYLQTPLRQQLDALPSPAAAPRVRLRWSGDRRGNAALVARSQPLRQGPGPSISNAENYLPEFVIGNGSRSRDGWIEILLPRSRSETIAAPQEVFITHSTAPATAAAPGQGPLLEITLIGTASHGPTIRQTAALGELLNHLEAVFGHRLVLENESASPPEAPVPPASQSPARLNSDPGFAHTDAALPIPAAPKVQLGV